MALIFRIEITQPSLDCSRPQINHNVKDDFLTKVDRLPVNLWGCFQNKVFFTQLVGGWTNLFEKYDRQIGSFFQGSGK